jgi:hypothetical protein
MYLQPIVLSNIAAGDAIFAFQVVGALFLIFLMIGMGGRSHR